MPDPCAHVGFGFLGARALFWLAPWCAPEDPLATLAVDALIVVCSNLPDLCDKPLFLLRFTKGTRSYGHTLLFLAVASVAAAVASTHFPSPMLTPACMFKVVATAVASHLLADMCFGYVPLFWPLQAFREKSTMKTPYTRPLKRALDLSALVYVSFVSGLPDRLGGWKVYSLVLLSFFGVTNGAIWIVKSFVRKQQFVKKQHEGFKSTDPKKLC